MGCRGWRMGSGAHRRKSYQDLAVGGRGSIKVIPRSLFRATGQMVASLNEIGKKTMNVL